MRISVNSCLPLRWSAYVTAAAIVLFVSLSGDEHALAIDPPHNGKNSLTMTISCTSCHYDTAGPTPSWATQPTTTDETYYNNLCTSCHMPSQMTDSRYVVKTHSSQNTSGKYTAWTVECRRCHNPHLQDQISSYPTDSTAILATGTIVSYTQVPVSSLQSTIIVSAGLTPNAWIDHILVPNVAYPTKMYHIRSNTNNSITVSGAIDGRYAKPGNTYAIRYGKMVRSEIGLPSGGMKTVKFFGASGMSSFGTSTDPANMTSICQVCHVNTASFNNAGTLEGPGHPALQAGRDCTVCHRHTAGFKAECGSCHGNPPLITVLGGPDGLALNDGGTGPTTPGAHGKHAVSLGYPCTTCHSGGMPASPIYDKLIQIGFNIANGAYQTGNYDGRVSLANGFTYTKGNAGTTVTNGGTKVCSNVYCHGATLAPDGGTNTTPAWGNAASGQCGTCHGVDILYNSPTRGAHNYIHVGQAVLNENEGLKYPCSLCHKDPSTDTSLHVNGLSEVTFSSADPKVAGGQYSGTPAVLDAYGTCTNVYCHSNVQTSPPGNPLTYRSPNWGAALQYRCYNCHFGASTMNATISLTSITGAITGNHAKHFTYNLGCINCHAYNPAFSGNINNDCIGCHANLPSESARPNHVNYAVDVNASKYWGTNITYSGTPQPGDAYGNCSNTYCHSNGTSVSTGSIPANASPPWGAGALACTSCHGYPPGYANGSPKANSHAKHAFHSFGCGECHAGTTSDGTTIGSTVNHVNKAYDVIAGGPRTFTYSYAAGGGACSTISCHNNGAATWGAFACDSCHDCPPPTGSHVKHFGTAAMYNAVYGDTRIAQDISGTAAVYIMNCGNCHPVDPAKHYNGTVEVELYSAQSPSGSLKSRNATSAEYTAGGTVFTDGRGFPYTQGTCQNVYCHSYNDWTTPGGVPESTDCSSYLPPNLVTTRYYRTPTWGSSALTCSGCHGIAPRTDYPANDGGSGDSHFWVDSYGYGNLHNWNMGYAPISCSFCHNETIRTQNTWTRDAMDVATQSDVPIYNYAKHVNGSTDVVFDRVNTFPYSTPYSLMSASYSPATKTCSNVSCHQSQTNVNWGTPYRWESTVECDRCHNFGGSCP